MPTNVDDPTLPVGCADQPAANLSADNCAPAFSYGPISNLYSTIAPFTTTPTAAEIARRLALAASAPNDPEAMTLFVGTVTLGGGTSETEEFNGRKYPKPTDREYAVKTKNISQAYYDFARSTQHGGLKRRFYGVSNDSQHWYGGLNGIEGLLTLRMTMQEDFNAINTLEGTISSRGFYDPKRIPSPVPAQ